VPGALDGIRVLEFSFIAAGPFLTTTTDVLGFFLFLGLATVFLL